MNVIGKLALSVVAVTSLISGGTAFAQVKQLEIIAPAGPGSGWDQASRAVEEALKAEGLVNRVKVSNIAGAGGTVGLSQFLSSKQGQGDTVLTCGFTLISSPIVNKSPVSLADVVPIARLAGEYEVVVVGASSNFKTFGDVVAQFKANPGSVSWGGGGVGGTDHVTAALIAKAVGMDPKQVNFIGYDGGGELNAALLGGHVSLGIAGWQEFAQYVENGSMRVLGVAAPERLPGIDAPTLKEQDVAVVQANWRGVVAPKGISDKDREALRELFEKMVQGEKWTATLKQRGWTDLHSTPEEFAAFIAQQTTEVSAILAELGMAK